MLSTGQKLFPLLQLSGLLNHSNHLDLLAGRYLPASCPPFRSGTLAQCVCKPSLLRAFAETFCAGDSVTSQARILADDVSGLPSR